MNSGSEPEPIVFCGGHGLHFGIQIDNYGFHRRNSVLQHGNLSELRSRDWIFASNQCHDQLPALLP